uniref:Homing endonuclease LAGLIDADG domain-containing protein n=1 Tax=Dactylella sp. TaxID=1814903 RepID=A0A482DVL5_9PEZI|nr:hypothetical protein [Dactylella sp.]
MFSMLAKYLNSEGINSLVTSENKAGTTTLRIEGVEAIAHLVPLFKNYSNLTYWKSKDINILLTIFNFHSGGVHLYRKGLMAILEILYKNPNKRIKSLSEWKELIENYFNSADTKYISGYQFISPIIKDKKKVGWLVRFSVRIVTVNGEKLKNKSFFYSSYSTEAKALIAALEYRDIVILSHLKEWQSQSLEP